MSVRRESLTLAPANPFSDFNFRSSSSATVSNISPRSDPTSGGDRQTLLNSVIEECEMNVSLTPELERFVDAKVESGLYNNASEVVREGLRLLKEQDEIRVRWREQIERGWLDAQAGRCRRRLAASMARIKQRLTTRSKRGVSQRTALPSEPRPTSRPSLTSLPLTAIDAALRSCSRWRMRSSCWRRGRASVTRVKI